MSKILSFIFLGFLLSSCAKNYYSFNDRYVDYSESANVSKKVDFSVKEINKKKLADSVYFKTNSLDFSNVKIERKKLKLKRNQEKLKIVYRELIGKIDTLKKDSLLKKSPNQELGVEQGDKAIGDLSGKKNQADQFALLSFLFGAMSLGGLILIGFLAGFFAIPAVIFANKAIKGNTKDKTLAQIGKVFGIISIAASIILLALVILLIGAFISATNSN
jgi:hypothetical protein